MKVYVIHGSPLSGKSTYVKEHIGKNDLVYDFDNIMSAISGLEVHERSNNLIEYVIAIRNIIIAKLKSEANIENVYIITTKVTEELKESLVGLNPIYKEMKVSITEAKKRLKDNPCNRDIEEWTKAIDRYFMSTKDYTDFHNTSQWKDKRRVILKRDGYLCKECSRYGNTTEANTVHHIIPIEERPDLRLDNDNLISLCEEHHEKMHNKYKDTLSKLGMELKHRATRRYPRLLNNIPPI